MIDKRKLHQAKDLNEFLILEKNMSMSCRAYKENLNCLRLCARDARLTGDEEELKFYTDLIKSKNHVH